MDLIAEFRLIFILLKISANFVYYTSYVVCYKKLPLLFLSIKKDRVKKKITKLSKDVGNINLLKILLEIGKKKNWLSDVEFRKDRQKNLQFK